MRPTSKASALSCVVSFIHHTKSFFIASTNLKAKKTRRGYKANKDFH